MTIIFILNLMPAADFKNNVGTGAAKNDKGCVML